MAATTTRRRAAIYARISDDRDDTGLGVARQESDCRARVETEGWDLVGTYIDNDISAFSGRPRPRWEALVADVRSGQVDRIVCWAADRLTRSLRELEDLVELLNETGVRIIALKDGEYDLSTSGGRMIARILGSVARQESERKSERQRRKAEEIALTGRPGGGGTRAFGYEDDAVTINPTEATAIRDAAVRILAGETLNSILKDWHARGIESVMGGSMSATSFRRMMISPRIAGLRAFRGQIIGDAAWPAILDRDTWEKLRRRAHRSESEQGEEPEPLPPHRRSPHLRTMPPADGRPSHRERAQGLPVHHRQTGRPQLWPDEDRRRRPRSTCTR